MFAIQYVNLYAQPVSDRLKIGSGRGILIHSA